jgi:hypothetical protein
MFPPPSYYVPPTQTVSENVLPDWDGEFKCGL